MKRSKAIRTSSITQKHQARTITPADLMRVYQQEAEKQRLLVKKSDYTQTKLLFIVEALKELLSDDSFTTLLRAEGLNTMPRALESRIMGGQQQ
jgi:ParB family chromosome partitioning protein